MYIMYICLCVFIFLLCHDVLIDGAEALAAGRQQLRHARVADLQPARRVAREEPQEVPVPEVVVVDGELLYTCVYIYIYDK